MTVKTEPVKSETPDALREYELILEKVKTLPWKMDGENTFDVMIVPSFESDGGGFIANLTENNAHDGVESSNGALIVAASNAFPKLLALWRAAREQRQVLQAYLAGRATPNDGSSQDSWTAYIAASKKLDEALVALGDTASAEAVPEFADTWIIYDHPPEAEKYFVVRHWRSTPADVKIMAAIAVDTLEQAREIIPPGLTMHPHKPSNAVHAILEAWG